MKAGTKTEHYDKNWNSSYDYDTFIFPFVEDTLVWAHLLFPTVTIQMQ